MVNYYISLMSYDAIVYYETVMPINFLTIETLMVVNGYITFLEKFSYCQHNSRLFSTLCRERIKCTDNMSVLIDLSEGRAWIRSYVACLSMGLTYRKTGPFCSILLVFSIE